MMACPGLETGTSFVTTMLSHVDCQAVALGTHGHWALSDPNSPVAAAATGLLTIFVGLFGLRLMFGSVPARRGIFEAVLKIGVVLTLTGSWPAWRDTGYNLVLNGPAEVASSMGLTSGLYTANFSQRIQSVDNAIVALTTSGSGLMEYVVATGHEIDLRRGVAMSDSTGLSWGRIAFLTGVLAPVVLIRILAGTLLALTPLIAGFFLFRRTSDLFYGWTRGLSFCALSALVLSILVTVETAMLGSWLRDALATRGLGKPALSSPTELMVITLAILFVNAGALSLVARWLFFSSSHWVRGVSGGFGDSAGREYAKPIDARPAMHPPLQNAPLNRAHRVADSVAQAMQREDRKKIQAEHFSAAHSSAAGERGATLSQSIHLGNSYRSPNRRGSLAAGRRDA